MKLVRIVIAILPIIIIIAGMLLNLAWFWLVASGIGSSVKALTKNCGQTCAMDNVLKTDFFCPIK